jgi:hypothetical protein
VTPRRPQPGAPVVLVCFDILVLQGTNLTTRPLSERRLWLESLRVAQHTCLQLVTQTDDRRVAEEWLALLPEIEGVVAKRADGRYLPGRHRDWLKVKRERTADCAVIAIVGDRESLRLVLAPETCRQRVAPIRTLPRRPHAQGGPVPQTHPRSSQCRIRRDAPGSPRSSARKPCFRSNPTQAASSVVPQIVHATQHSSAGKDRTTANANRASAQHHARPPQSGPVGPSRGLHAHPKRRTPCFRSRRPPSLANPAK